MGTRTTDRVNREAGSRSHELPASPPMPDAASARTARRSVLAEIVPYQGPLPALAMRQLTITLAAWVAVLALMYAGLGISVWLAWALAPLAGFLLVRIFIIQHDCGHGSFLRSRRANDAIGWMCSVLTWTPYANWRVQHAYHHSAWNNLDRRSGRDIYSGCLTVAEYRALTPLRRWVHRVMLHPLVSQVALPPIIFFVLYRFPFDTPLGSNRERASVHRTSLAIAALYAGLALILGTRAVLLVQAPVIAIASIIGVWLFSVQHRFESALWTNNAAWDPITAGLHGSSYLRLPGWLHWFTGNIALHHLHHLSPRIPNYRLQACQRACAVLAESEARALSIGEALRAGRYVLWDESLGRMVRFADLDRRWEAGIDGADAKTAAE
jgi:acyl-lipid omega-6 desaturase (Delta-12 desaturase)